jgi:hypothetical protein
LIISSAYLLIILATYVPSAARQQFAAIGKVLVVAVPIEAAVIHSGSMLPPDLFAQRRFESESGNRLHFFSQNGPVAAISAINIRSNLLLIGYSYPS